MSWLPDRGTGPTSTAPARRRLHSPVRGIGALVGPEPRRDGMELRPIGVIHTPFEDTEGMPIQPSGAKGIRGTVEVLPEFAEGLKDLEGFSHVTLIFHFHRAKEHRLIVTPFMGTEPRGVFATRSPSRPNPIGLSTVRLIAVRGNVLDIDGVDMLDGTPLLDIKPYVPEFDSEVEIRLGWLERHRGRSRNPRSDDRFR